MRLYKISGSYQIRYVVWKDKEHTLVQHESTNRDDRDLKVVAEDVEVAIKKYKESITGFYTTEYEDSDHGQYGESRSIVTIYINEAVVLNYVDLP